jgi:hypothetical protein
MIDERYMTDTRPYRTDRRFFIYKMPNNFRHIGLIHLMLPAKIIDVRREPMACCFSNLKQLFAAGQEFTYSMEDIARYHRTYLDLMRHWEAVPPDECGEYFTRTSSRISRETFGASWNSAPSNLSLPASEFYKTERSVGTPSSEQVRQPILREALHQWRDYECWLGPLKEALGDALVRHREFAETDSRGL